MLDFAKIIDKKTGKPIIKTSITGKHLLALPQLNKGTAFTQSEREQFGLLGKLPHRIETLDEQVTRAYLQLSQYTTPLQKNIYLNNLHDSTIMNATANYTTQNELLLNNLMEFYNNEYYLNRML